MLRPCHKYFPNYQSGPLIDGINLIRSDFPVTDRPHSYGEPTVYQWQGVDSGYFSGGRAVMALRYSASTPSLTHYVLGGVHLTASSFLPTTLLKDLTGTEYSGTLDLSVLRDMTAVQHFNDLQVSSNTICLILCCRSEIYFRSELVYKYLALISLNTCLGTDNFKNKINGLELAVTQF